MGLWHRPRILYACTVIIFYSLHGLNLCLHWLGLSSEGSVEAFWSVWATEIDKKLIYVLRIYTLLLFRMLWMMRWSTVVPEGRRVVEIDNLIFRNRLLQFPQNWLQSLMWMQRIFPMHVQFHNDPHLRLHWPSHHFDGPKLTELIEIQLHNGDNVIYYVIVTLQNVNHYVIVM